MGRPSSGGPTRRRPVVVDGRFPAREDPIALVDAGAVGARLRERFRQEGVLLGTVARQEAAHVEGAVGQEALHRLPEGPCRGLAGEAHDGLELIAVLHHGRRKHDGAELGEPHELAEGVRRVELVAGVQLGDGRQVDRALDQQRIVVVAEPLEESCGRGGVGAARRDGEGVLTTALDAPQHWSAVARRQHGDAEVEVGLGAQQLLQTPGAVEQEGGLAGGPLCGGLRAPGVEEVGVDGVRGHQFGEETDGLLDAARVEELARGPVHHAAREVLGRDTVCIGGRGRELQDHALVEPARGEAQVEAVHAAVAGLGHRVGLLDERVPGDGRRVGVETRGAHHVTVVVQEQGSAAEGAVGPGVDLAAHGRAALPPGGGVEAVAEALGEVRFEGLDQAQRHQARDGYGVVDLEHVGQIAAGDRRLQRARIGVGGERHDAHAHVRVGFVEPLDARAEEIDGLGRADPHGELRGLGERVRAERERGEQEEGESGSWHGRSFRGADGLRTRVPTLARVPTYRPNVMALYRHRRPTGAGPTDARWTRRTSRTGGGSGSRPSMRARSISKAVAPTRSRGCATVVRRGQ